MQSSTSTSLKDGKKQQQHREVVRAWFASHPGYQQRYNADRKRLRNETGTSLNGTLPVKKLTKIPYSITHKRPLTPGERVSPPRPSSTSTKRRHMLSHEHSDNSEPFEPSDFW